jgi:hypothetical protein
MELRVSIVTYSSVAIYGIQWPTRLWQPDTVYVSLRQVSSTWPTWLAWLATCHQQKSANRLSSGSCGQVIYLNSCNKPLGDHMNNTFKINSNISWIWGKHYLKDEQFTLQVQPILGCSRYSLIHTIRVNLHLKLESPDPMAASRSVVELGSTKHTAEVPVKQLNGNAVSTFRTRRT